MPFLTQALSRLADFSGRDPRRLFWPYAAVVVALSIVAMGVVNSMFVGVFVARISANEIPDLSGMVLAMGVEIVAIIALLAAAVVRRLHDTDRAGYWGLAPLPFLTFSFVGFYGLVRTLNQPTGDVPPLFFQVFFSNALYMCALLLLIVLLALPTKTGVNRYGEPPAP